jgi:hypothetical protein
MHWKSNLCYSIAPRFRRLCRGRFAPAPDNRWNLKGARELPASESISVYGRRMRFEEERY